MPKYILNDEIKREIINKLIVTMKRGDKKVLEIAGALGSWIDSSDKFADLPVKDQLDNPVSKGDTSTLSVKDGDKPAGLYRYNGSEWIVEINYDAMKVDELLANLKATQAEVDAGTNDKKFVTPKTLKKIMDTLKNLYHPKGGKATLKVIGKDADKGTQEFITAKQMEFAFEQADLDALYDAA